MGREMPKPNEYKIETLDDLADVVTVENVDRLSDDVRLWLRGIAEIYEGVRKALPVECADKRNSEIAKAAFTWTDDGKNEQTGLNVSFDLKGKP